MPHTVTHFTTQQLLSLVIPLFFYVAQEPNSGLDRLIVKVCRSRHTDRCLQNTQQTQQRNIHALSGVQTRDPSNQMAADLSVRSHGYRDRHPTPITYGIYGIEYQTVSVDGGVIGTLRCCWGFVRYRRGLIEVPFPRACGV
jgi:hypothetical protein